MLQERLAKSEIATHCSNNEYASTKLIQLTTRYCNSIPSAYSYASVTQQQVSCELSQTHSHA